MYALWRTTSMTHHLDKDALLEELEAFGDDPSYQELAADVQAGKFDAKPLPPTEAIPTVAGRLSAKQTPRSPWYWPLVALSALLVVVLGGTILALTLGGTQ